MPKLYEALAEAFLAEGVDTQFVLMGDGNMHWSTAFAKLPGVHTVHVRHEHVTVAAATAYNVATNKVAVASVTCGPGVTQLMTALPAAVRARLPMVVFAGESPINAKFYNQAIDQAPLVTATGAHYIAAHSVPRMMDYVREAFHIAKYERQPVVLGIPYDLQKVEHMANAPYETSAMYRAQGRAHAPRSRARGRGGRAAGRGEAADHPRRPWRAVVRRARCGDQARRPLRRASLQHAARARPVPRPSVRARHHRQLLHIAGPGDVRVRGRRARGRHQPVLLRRWRALLAEGLQDPVGRRPARLARRAEGRRPLRQIGCARRRRGDPCRPRQEAGRRQTDGGGDPHQGAGASHRDRAGGLRCRSTSRPANSIRAR